MRILKEGKRENKERVFRFFCDCECVWEAKWHEVLVTLVPGEEKKCEAVCECPYCGRIKKGVEV